MSIQRDTMRDWVIQALRELGGRAMILDINKKVQELCGEEIGNTGDLFYEWQYELRWAGDLLRREGKIRLAKLSPKGKCELT